MSSFRFRLSTLDRYFARQYLWPFILSIGAFGIVGIVDIIFYLIELSVLSGISFKVVFQLILFKLPAILVLFAPVGVLFSIMLLLVRMIKDNEFLVLLSSGISVKRIAAPLVALSLITSIVAYITNETIVPWTNHRSEAIIAKEIDRKPPPEIAENVVFKGTDDRFFYVNKVNRKTGELRSVVVFESTVKYPRILIAEKAQWGLNEWHLWNGNIYEFNDDAGLEFTNTFTHMKINILQNLGLLDMTNKSPTEMDSRELRDHITILEKSGISTQPLKVEYGLKHAVPVACLVFGILGIAFCLTFITTGKDWWGVVVAIGIASVTVMLYFFMMAVFRALGKGGSISPFWAAWASNITFGVFGAGVLWYRAERR